MVILCKDEEAAVMGANIEKRYNRKMYERVKTMDTQEMRDFLFSTYNDGYKRGYSDGEASVHVTDEKLKITEEELISALYSIKGIGFEKTHKIKEKIMPLLLRAEAVIEEKVDKS